MADAAGLVNVTRVEMGTVLKVITGKCDTLREVALALLTLGKGNIPWGYENNMRVARIFDKLEKRYAIPGMDATRGFQDCCEESSTTVPQESPNRENCFISGLPG